MQMICPICKHEPASLSIWEDPATHETHFKCYYSIAGRCHPTAIAYALQALGFNTPPPQSYSPAQHSKTYMEIWQAGIDIVGTHADEYLHARCIQAPSNFRNVLRFIPYLKHIPSNSLRLPCLLALITNPRTATHQGLYRTYLHPLNPEKAAALPNRQTLGKVDGGVIDLTYLPSKHVTICEGLETALSYRQMFKDANVWCAMGVGNLPRIMMPDYVREVTIAADNDDAGVAAAGFAKDVYTKMGLRTEIRRPHDNFKDFNDQLYAAISRS